jgi:hypothetical protein
MPLNSRSFLDLALLTPGATPSAGGSQVTGSNVAGARTQSNDYLIDGISNMDKQVNGGLTSFLEWKRQSLHQGDGDFLFPSIRLSGTHRAARRRRSIEPRHEGF